MILQFKSIHQQFKKITKEDIENDAEKSILKIKKNNIYATNNIEVIEFLFHEINDMYLKNEDDKKNDNVFNIDIYQNILMDVFAKLLNKTNMNEQEKQEIRNQFSTMMKAIEKQNKLMNEKIISLEKDNIMIKKEIFENKNEIREKLNTSDNRDNQIQSKIREMELEIKKLKEDSNAKTETIEKIKKNLICPISSNFITYPAITKYGNTFENNNILEWFEKKKTDPQNNYELTKKEVFPNNAIFNIINILKED